MSSHYIYVRCGACGKVESLYTGSIETYEFDDSDWEGEYIPVAQCIECKAAELHPPELIPGTMEALAGLTIRKETEA